MAGVPDSKLLQLCCDIAESAADSGGFVSVKALAEVLRVQVEWRPLLVEAMIAAPKAQNHGAQPWKVLIDSDTYADARWRFDTESPKNSLPNRLRNTVAHELAHSLCARSTEFGYEFPKPGRKESTDQAVQRLERAAEGLSPVLLIPQSTLERECAAGLLNSIEGVCLLRERWAVSREVFVSRLVLGMRHPRSALRYHSALENLSIGMGEWSGKGMAQLLDWPLFSNFADGIVPEFLIQLRKRVPPAIGELFPSPSFVLNGGSDHAASESVFVGTSRNPRSESRSFEIQVESVAHSSGSRFFFLLRAKPHS